MRGFAIGLVVGAAIAGAVGAFAAEIIGDGALLGWTVAKGGQIVCVDPNLDIVSRTLNCD